MEKAGFDMLLRSDAPAERMRSGGGNLGSSKPAEAPCQGLAEGGSGAEGCIPFAFFLLLFLLSVLYFVLGGG